MGCPGGLREKKEKKEPGGLPASFHFTMPIPRRTVRGSAIGCASTHPRGEPRGDVGPDAEEDQGPDQGEACKEEEPGGPLLKGLV
jgi:hypothetical protein